jgi:hypothetical protein
MNDFIKHMLICFSTFCLSTNLHSQRSFGLHASYGSVLTSTLEHSKNLNFVKQRRAFDLTYQLGISYQRGKNTFALSYRRFVHVVSFKISGTPIFKAKEGFDEVSYRVPINSLNLMLERSIWSANKYTITAYGGIGALIKRDGILTGYLSYVDKTQLIRGKELTLEYSLVGTSSGYFTIPNAKIGSSLSRALTNKSKISIALSFEQDWRPLVSHYLICEIPNPNNNILYYENRTLISGTNRMYLDLGYTYHFGKTTKTAPIKQKKGKK